jgi:hypothetical protein
MCSGPSHAEPVTLPLDAEHWYFHRSGVSKGKPVTPCRQCMNWKKLIKREGPHGWVPVTMVAPYVHELVDRCGSIYRARLAHGFAEDTLRQVLLGNREKMQKRTAARVLVALREQRLHDRKNGTSKRFIAVARSRARSEILMERKP